MTQINRTEIWRRSHVFTRDQMKNWLCCQLDRKMTDSEFDKLMRDILPKESQYQTQILHYIRDTYPQAFVWKAAAGPYSRQGIPDVCAIIEGQFYGFEIKRPYIGRLSKIQERTIQAIREAGGVAAVVSFPEQVQEVISHG